MQKNILTVVLLMVANVGVGQERLVNQLSVQTEAFGEQKSGLVVVGEAVLGVKPNITTPKAIDNNNSVEAVQIKKQDIIKPSAELLPKNINGVNSETVINTETSTTNTGAHRAVAPKVPAKVIIYKETTQVTTTKVEPKVPAKAIIEKETAQVTTTKVEPKVSAKSIIDKETAQVTTTKAVTKVQPQAEVIDMNVTSKKTENYVFELDLRTPMAVSDPDPWKNFNRGMYKFNRFFDALYIKPLALTYEKVPKPIRGLVNDFFSNIGEVPTIINFMLQGRLKLAGDSCARLFINSTIGILGLVDVASHYGYEKHPQDFGLTLKYWGYQNSCYVVLPLLGPSTFRDTFAFPVNLVMSPNTYLKPKWRNRYYAANTLNKRTYLLDTEEVIHEASVDEYSLVKSGYLDRRQSLLMLGGGDNINKNEVLEGPPE